MGISVNWSNIPFFGLLWLASELCVYHLHVNVLQLDNLDNFNEINYSVDNKEKILNLTNRRIWFNKNDNLDYICIEIFKMII
jgi:hypothetical protein